MLDSEYFMNQMHCLIAGRSFFGVILVTDGLLLSLVLENAFMLESGNFNASLLVKFVVPHVRRGELPMP